MYNPKDPNGAYAQMIHDANQHTFRGKHPDQAAQGEDHEAEVARRMSEIDVHDTASVVHFGTKAQERLQEISQTMLADVQNKDVGPAGESLRGIVTTIRGFSVDKIDVRRARSWWERLTGRMAPFARFVARYEEVQGQLHKITGDLERHQHALLKDISSLDVLYQRTLEFHHDLSFYIAAGGRKIAEIDTALIPAKEREVERADEDSTVLRAQELRDLRAVRDDLERRVHDLKLTHQVTMQSLPSIRLVQENDKSLMAKITSTLVNTVPLWKTQLAQAVTIQRSAQAAGAVKQATDLTNDLLTSNARNLRAANASVRTEMERGVFDIESIKIANAELIATIEDSLRIADAGKAKREAARDELVRMEKDLRTALTAAKAREHAAIAGPRAKAA